MSSSDNSLYAFGEFQIDSGRRLVLRQGQAITLTPKPYELLLLLVQRAGQPVSKDELLKGLWPDTIAEENNLAVTVSALRRTLGERRGERQFIVTLPGVGYQFVMPVTVTTTPTPKVNEPEAEAVSDVNLTPLAAVVASAPADIASAPAHPDSPSPQVLPAVPLRRRYLWAGLAVCAVLASLAGWYWYNRPPQRVSQVRTLAVLPFTPLVAPNDSSQNSDEALGLGLADALIMRLSNSSGIIVRPTNAIQAFTAPIATCNKSGARCKSKPCWMGAGNG